jgi:hypothetical protein
MAKFTRDPASKATWNRMAERWQHCAEVFDRQRATRAQGAVATSAFAGNGHAPPQALGSDVP